MSDRISLGNDNLLSMNTNALMSSDTADHLATTNDGHMDS